MSLRRCFRDCVALWLVDLWLFEPLLRPALTLKWLRGGFSLGDSDEFFVARLRPFWCDSELGVCRGKICLSTETSGGATKQPITTITSQMRRHYGNVSITSAQSVVVALVRSKLGKRVHNNVCVETRNFPPKHVLSIHAFVCERAIHQSATEKITLTLSGIAFLVG